MWSSGDFAERMAYDRVEPWHAPALDFWGSQLCALLAETNRNPDKRKEPYKPADFLPKFLADRLPKRPPQSRAEMWGELVGFFRGRAQMIEAQERKRKINEDRAREQPPTRYKRRGSVTDRLAGLTVATAAPPDTTTNGHAIAT